MSSDQPIGVGKLKEILDDWTRRVGTINANDISIKVDDLVLYIKSTKR